MKLLSIGGDEMENELILDIEQIEVIQGSIDFKHYENIKHQAIELADKIAAVEVTDNNIKHSKKLLAAVNKRLKELEDKRISIKKMMLEPYQTFENQVKEIVAIVKTADSEIREQVKHLEEAERIEKRAAIEEIFKKRKKHYILGELIKFVEFLQPKHLNKSTSIESIEKEMTEFFEKITVDYNVIKSMNNADEILSVYIGNYDLAKALALTNEKEALKAALNDAGALTQVEATNTTYFIILHDEKDFILTKLLLDQHNIQYAEKEGF